MILMGNNGYFLGKCQPDGKWFLYDKSFEELYH